MKKKVIICLIAVVLVLAICIGLWAQWLFSPGVHTFWRFANFDISERKCYIVDYETEEIIGQSTMTIRGFDYEKRKGGSSRDDDVEVKVEGYTQIIEGNRTEEPFVLRVDDRWRVHYSEYEYVVNETGFHRLYENYIKMWVMFGIVEPDDIIAVIMRVKGESQECVYAVCAESEAAALEVIQARKPLLFGNS